MKNTISRRKGLKKRTIRWDRVSFVIIILVLTVMMMIQAGAKIQESFKPFEERYEPVYMNLRQGDTAYNVQLSLTPSLSRDQLNEIEWHFERTNEVENWGNLRPGRYYFYKKK